MTEIKDKEKLSLFEFEKGFERLSSHPCAQEYWRTISKRCAFAPLVAVTVLILFKLADISQLGSLFVNLKYWTVVAFASTAFLVTVWFTTVMWIGWSNLKRRGVIATLKGGDCCDQFLINHMWFFVASALLTLGVTIGLSRSTFTPPSVRLFCQFVTIFPFVGICVVMLILATHVPGKPITKPNWSVFIILFALVVCLLILTVVYDIATLYQQTWLSITLKKFVPGYASLETPFIGTIVLIPVLFAISLIWRLWREIDRVLVSIEKTDRDTVDVSEEDQHDAKEIKDVSCDHRGCPLLLLKLTEMHSPHWTCLSEPKKLLGRKTGGHSDNEETVFLEQFFDCTNPSVEQLNVIERFIQSFEQSENKARMSTFEGSYYSDILIEGMLGAGKTVSAIACALYSAFVRGQWVVFVTANANHSDLALRRISSTLEHTQFSQYIDVDQLDYETVRSYTSSDTTQLAPRILVATFDMLENLLGDYELSSNSLVQRFELVIVEDFLEFTDSQRSALPFFLDKLRLIMDVACRPFRWIMTVTPLAPLGRENLLSRMSTSKKQNIQLSEATGPAIWILDMISDNPASALGSLAVDCLTQDLHVLVYETRIEVLKNALSEVTQNANGNLYILNSLGDVIPETFIPDVVLFEIVSDCDPTANLRRKLAQENLAFITVRHKSTSLDIAKYGYVPVVSSRSAFPLLIQHLRSILRFLRPETPIPSTVLKRFGVDWDTIPLTRFPDDNPPDIQFSHDEWRERKYERLLWPYASLCDTGKHIVSAGMVDEAASLFRSSRPMKWFTGKIVTENFLGCQANWKSQHNQFLGTVDLLHLTEIVLHHHGLVLIPFQIDRYQEQYIFHAQEAKGNMDDYYLPVWQFEFTLSEEKCALHLITGDDRLAFVRFCTENESRPLIGSKIVGRMNENGQIKRNTHVPFQYPADISAILINARIDLGDSEDLKDATALLSGHWATESEQQSLSIGSFSPELTYALNYAFRHRFSGLLYYARVIAFSLKGEAARLCSAVAFIIEPISSGRTASDFITRLFNDSVELRCFLRSCDWMLDCIQHVGSVDHPERARMLARQAFDEDDDWSKIKLITDLLKQILFENRLPSAREKLPIQPVDPHDPRLLDIEPVVAIPEPDWDPAASVTTWKDCIDQLWRVALSHFPHLNQQPLDVWDYNLLLGLGISSVEEKNSIETVYSSIPKNKHLALTMRDSRIFLSPKSRLKGSVYKSHLIAFLEKDLSRQKLALNVTVSLQLWALSKNEDAQNRFPLLWDPLNIVMIGGYNAEGLILASVPSSIVAPKPPGPDSSQESEMGVDGVVPMFSSANLKYEKPTRYDMCDIISSHSLPALPSLSVSNTGVDRTWQYNGKSYSLWMQYDQSEMSTLYLEFIHKFEARPSSESYACYITNDPFLGFMHSIGEKLLGLYGGKVDSEFGKFLLAFTQSFTYISDPNKLTDWPRFPSEFLFKKGGDCEDSSIFLMFLLKKYGFDSAFLLMEKHMAIGIAGPYTGTSYGYKGTDYYYAESATNDSYLPLGLDSPLAGRARVLPCIFQQTLESAPVQVINGYIGHDDPDSFYCVLALGGECVTAQYALALYVRRSIKVFDLRPNPVLLNAVWIELSDNTDLKQMVTLKAKMNWANLGTATGNFYLDVVVWSQQKVVGLWTGIASFTRGCD